MNTKILSLATATPKLVWTQTQIANKIVEMLGLSPEESSKLHQLYANSAIGSRHSVIPDFAHERADWTFWGKEFPHTPPGTEKRNKLYKKEAPALALEAAKKALENSHVSPEQITHVISVSCTGILAPGIEFHLIEKLNLKRSVFRLGVNMMGCFGAFKGLHVADAFAKENPDHRILLVCTELCSLHLQTEFNQDNLLGNAIFADGAGAVILGCQPKENEKSLFTIERNCSMALENSQDKMTWEASDHGFIMKLSSFVPSLLKRNIHHLTDVLLKDISPQDCDWPIHPGGKSVLDAVERALNLTKEQTLSSWSTLWNYGNMSSATLLFVLENLLKQKERKQWAAAVGFGPGLSMEGILLKNE